MAYKRNDGWAEGFYPTSPSAEIRRPASQLGALPPPVAVCLLSIPPLPRQRFGDLLASWEPYHHLWQLDRRATMRAVSRRRPSLTEFETEMQRYKDIEAELAAKPATCRVGALVICTGQTSRLTASESSGSNGLRGTVGENQAMSMQIAT